MKTHLRTIWLTIITLLLIKTGILFYAKNNANHIETIYSRGIYPFISNILTCISNNFQFSLGELLLGILLIKLFVIICLSVILILKRQLRAALLMISYLVLCATIIFNYFDLAWLLNNYRLDVKNTMMLSNDSYDINDLEDTYTLLITRTNELRRTLTEDNEGLPSGMSVQDILQTSYEGYESLNKQYSFINDKSVQVKSLFTSPLQTISGYTGVYLFFIGEPAINTNAPIITLPHTAAHEIAHQKGFAQEGAANYIGFLACKYHDSKFIQYSGYLSALEYVGNALRQTDLERYIQFNALYDEKVINDLLYIDSFWNQARIESATEVVNGLNDTYLKSYNQPDGLQSYDQFVDLLVADYLKDDEL